MNDVEPVVGRVAEFIRSQVGGQVTSAEDLEGRVRFARSLERPEARAWVPIGLGLAAAGLVVFFGVRSQQISYVVNSGPRTASGEAAPLASAVQFSDGSRFELAAGAVGQVTAAGFRGADFSLERGALQASVVHRSLTSWSVQAGPFRVLVKGTRFSVSWSPGEQRFVLSLQEGSVEVQGTLMNGGRSVKAGERLTADLALGRVSLEHERAPDVKVEVPAASSDQAAAAAAAPAAGPTPLDLGSATPQSALPVAPLRPKLVPSSGAELAPQLSWAEQVAAGNFQSVLADAKARGIDVVLSGDASTELSALADAARYLGDQGLASRTLAAQRQRFPGTERAAMAAYLLGRLAEDRGESQAAVTWYDRYLAEQPRGTFAQEALGRKMLALRGRDSAGAASVARQYLARYPGGPRATIAQQLASQH